MTVHFHVRRVRKVAEVCHQLHHAPLSVRIYHGNSHLTNCHEILYWETFMKTYRENLNLGKIGQTHRTLYVKA